MSLEGRIVDQSDEGSKSKNRKKTNKIQTLTDLDITPLVSSVKENPTEENFKQLNDRLKEFRKLGPKDAIVQQQWLNEQDAEIMFKILLNYCGMKNQETNKLEKIAFPCLEIFYALTLHDEMFQDVVETTDASTMREMDFTSHILEGDEEHRKVVASLTYFLSKNIKKLEDWHRYVNVNARDVLSQYMDEIETGILEKSRLSMDSRLPSSVQNQYYDVSCEQVCEIFKTDPNVGLSHEEVAARRLKYGKNELPKPKRTSIFVIFLRQLADFMVLILIITAIVALAIQEYKASVVLALVVIFNVLIGFVQEVKAERALASLLKLTVQNASVIRGKQVQVITADELVPGDIVVLEEGVQVPADLRLIEQSELNIVEILLTGESIPIEKSTETIVNKDVPIADQTNMAFMSTIVSKGRGKGVVVAIGKNTEIGKVSKRISSAKSRKTPLQRKLTILSIILVILSFLLCLLVIVVGIIHGIDYMDMIKVGISLAVSVIPEGLVAVTTITMALGVQRMSKKNAIIRQLPAVETLGSVTTICSDKTGTLTEGKMVTNEICTMQNHYTIKEKKITCGDKEGMTKEFEQILMVSALCNNSTIRLDDDISNEIPVYQTVGDPTEIALMFVAYHQGLYKPVWIEQKGFEFKKEYAFDSDRKRMSVVYKIPEKEMDLVKGLSDLYNKSKVQNEKIEIVEEAPKDIPKDVNEEEIPKEEKVDSNEEEIPNKEITNEENVQKEDLNEEKIVTENIEELVKGEEILNEEKITLKVEEEITLKVEEEKEITTKNEVLVTLSKGAVESLLLICTHVQTEYGKIIPLTDEEKEKIEQKSFNMSKKGLRVLGLAYKINSKDDDILQMDHIERNLVFLGFAGIMDPPRENVHESIETCKKAGIKICMITGDHPSTAKSIAIKLGIIPEDAGDGYIITGKEFDQLVVTNKLDTLNPIPQVFARVSPENKYQIVEYLQKQDVVAMIGDGVNDASSIKKSDVGVAMGLSGTDIAKQSASIILADDNFSSIVAAVKEGRRTLDNIIKFIMYLLSCNFAEIIVTLVAVSANITIPFTSMQILFANLVADVPPSLSLGAEPASKNVMNRLPRHPKSNIFSIYGWFILLLQSFIMSAISLFGLVSAIYLEDYPIDKARTFTFMLLTVIQLLHAFHSRSFIDSIFQVNPFGNLWLIFGVFFSLACMVGGLYIPVINTLLELVPLDWFDWVKILIGAVLHFILMEMIKVLLRLKRRFVKKKKDAKFYSEL